MSDEPAELPAGRVGRPHGLDGSFYVTGAVPRLLTLGASVGLDGRRAEIVRRSGTDARPILRLRGVDTRDGAEALRGVELTVTASGAPQLSEGEWWAHELEQCEVFDGERRLGVVSRLLELPSCEAIEVQRPGVDDPLLVPLVRDAIREVDVAAARIDVDGEFLDLAAHESRAPRRPRRQTGGDEDAGGEGSGDGD
ncbi:MAG: ribosome maturation factor RimM [Solirubrobacteraceae bacterium]